MIAEQNAVVITPELEQNLVETVIDALPEDTESIVRGVIARTIREWFQKQEKK